MKSKGLFLAVICGFGLTQVQNTQAMNWFRKKPELSTFEKAKPWLIGGAVVAGIGAVIALREPIGGLALATTSCYEDDCKKMENSGFKALKKEVRESFPGNCPLSDYKRGLGLSQACLSVAGLINCRNSTGRDIDYRLVRMATVEREILKDPEYKAESRYSKQKEQLDRIEKKLDDKQNK